MRGSIKIGKEQYIAIESSKNKKDLLQKAKYCRDVERIKARVIKGRGVASKEYILYVLPKRPKGR